MSNREVVMARKGKNETSKTEEQEKQDVYVSEEIIEIENSPDSNNTQIVRESEKTEEVKSPEAEVIVSENTNAIDAAVKEYNGKTELKTF